MHGDHNGFKITIVMPEGLSVERNDPGYGGETDALSA